MTEREFTGLMWAVVILIVVVLAIVLTLMWPSGAANLPGGYAGRPPTDMRYPGRCWCVVHGPRGGCRHWQCRPKPSR